MGLLGNEPNENVTLIRQPTGALTKIIFGDGAEAFALHIREETLNDGSRKCTMSIIPTDECKQLNNIKDSDLQLGRMTVMVDADTIIELNKDPQFHTLFCTRSIYNKDTPFSMQNYVKKMETELSNSRKNFHVLQVEMGKKDMLLRRLAEGYISSREIADMVVQEIRKDLFGSTMSKG